MALRIKSHWHDSGQNDPENKSLDESAGALAFIAWRLALDKAKTLHGEDYEYRSDGQRIAVICEYLAYEIQVADRISYGMLEQKEREGFITTLAQKVAEHVQDNASDLFGPGDYKTGFINTLNERAQEYAEYDFTDDMPSYSFMRHLGHAVQKIMGDEKLNRWVIDQVMDIDAPDAATKIHTSLLNLLD